jgi:hypothetical protein
MNPKTPTRNSNSAPAGNGYAPSVPISIYKEVAAELQTTKAAMDALKTQNQQLIKQNQQLRQEIERAVQAALTLRQATGAMPVVNEVPAPRSQHVVVPDLELEDIEMEESYQAPVPPPPPARYLGIDSPFPPEQLVYEEDSKPRRKMTLDAESTKRELGGWWLAIAIIAIILTAFGAGFLLVRPFLMPSSK